jgi:hypothetical protein
MRLSPKGFSFILFAWSLAGCASSQAASSQAYTVTVAAGAFERIATPVTFALPGAALAGSWRLVGHDGRAVPLQLSGNDQATFVLDRLPAGETRSYRLEPGATQTAGGPQARVEGGAVTLSVGGEPVLRYHAMHTEPPSPETDPIYRRGGYIHPVYTPSGRLLTDDYPPAHLHHHGIWAAWSRTVFEGRRPDFWNMGQGTGTVEPVALDTTWSGPVHAGLRARHRYVDLTASTPTDALLESWTVQIYEVQGHGRPYRVFDLEVRQTTASDSPLMLPEYHYGGVGFRGHRDWDGAENTFFLTSEGRDRSDGHGTRARWCHIGGYVDGTLVGIAILGHPENFRFPQHMRIHPDEPFFNWAPSQGGDWAIQPGETYIARYRYVTYDGEPDAAELDRLWNDYAHPPAISVEAR